MRFGAIKIREAVHSEIFILSVAILFATVISLFVPSKLIAAFGVLIITILLYIAPPHFVKIVFPMIMITFPITLQYSGKDAVTTGTLIIFAGLAWALMKYRIGSTVAHEKFLFSLLFLLVSIAFIGMVTKTSGKYWGPAIRHYVSFLSSVAVFIFIIHSQKIVESARNHRHYIEKIIVALLWITMVHIGISLLLFNFQGTEQYFSVFFHRNQEHLSGYFLNGVFVRATTVFTAGEEFGELLVLLFPFSLYMTFVSKNKIYFLLSAVLFLGTILTGTRSAFLIVVFQLGFFVFVLVSRRHVKSKLVFAAASLAVSIVIVLIFLYYSPVLFNRFRDTIELITNGKNIFSILNRSTTWPVAYDLTTKTISLFGHGPIQACRLGLTAQNFHCLYLSLLFQFGIFGSVVFFLFFYTLAKRLLQALKKLKDNSPDYLLVMSCLVSFACFLVNEIKYEFNRADSYQQLVWIFFALFYLSSQLWRHSSHDKNHFH